MKGLTCLAALAAIFSAVNLQVADAQTTARPDPYRALFPDTSIVSFQHMLSPPAGKYGFLQTDKNGHFVWPDGKRAKFWGVNISNRSVFIKREDIDRIVDVLARAGTNMVRFEALDSTGALVDIPGGHSTRVMNQEQLATLDYWIAKLKERGIYYYLDLLDFRLFKEGDGVPGFDQIGRAAKPYAFFDRRLIDLQKEYAQQLLLHENSLTGLRYVDDPALALVEICNEHGLFFKAASLEGLVEPYGAMLKQQWNRWLLKQYGSRDSLKSAWGNGENGPVLADNEDPSSFSVALPLFSPAPPANGSAPASQDGRRMPVRVADGVRFLYDTQTAYFHEMKSFLKEIGVKVPITGVVSNDLVPDVASVAAELDFTSENYYADHPTFAGKDWEGTFFYNDLNPLRNASTYQIAPWLAGLRWENKPVVVREWAVVWPNRFRAVAIPEMASYACMQDFDAVLLFGYQTYRDPEILSDFDHQADPLVWGLYGLGAEMFLRGDVRKSASSATIAYTPETFFHWPNTIGNLHRLAWFVRLNSTLQTSATSKASPSENRKPSATLFPARLRIASRTIPRLQTPPRRPAPPPSPALSIIVPASNPDALPGLLDQFGQSGAYVSSAMLGTGVLANSSHEIVRRTMEGILTINTPRAISMCGEFPSTRSVETGGWSLTTQTGIGALMAVALDGRPLADSRKYIIKMVSRAENTGQELEAAPSNAPGRMHLKSWGKAPVLTFGRACELSTKIRKGNLEIVSLGIIDGSWELFVENGRAHLACDTPGIKCTVFGKPVTTVGGGITTVTIPPNMAPALQPAKRAYAPTPNRMIAARRGKLIRTKRKGNSEGHETPRRRSAIRGRRNRR